MKAKLLIIIWIIFPLFGFSQLKPDDLKWANKIAFSENFEISFILQQGNTFYYPLNNYIKITSGEKTKISKVKFENGEVTKISDSIYYIFPNKIGKSIFTINEDTNSFMVEELDDEIIELKFSASTSPYDDCISIEELKKSDHIIATFANNQFEIKDYYIWYSGTQTHPSRFLNSCDSNFLVLLKKYNEEASVNERVSIDLKSICIKGKPVKFIADNYARVVDNYQNEYIRKMKLSPLVNNLTIMKNDLRIKIEGPLAKEDKKAIDELINKLNGLLETIQVKMVEKQPSLTIIIDTLSQISYTDTSNTAQLIRNGFKTKGGDFFYKEMEDDFFPFNKQYIIYFGSELFGGKKSQQKKTNAIDILLSSIVDLFYNFNLRTFNKYNGEKFYLTDNNKYFIKTLYSRGGEEKIKAIINPDHKEKENTPVYFLLLMLTVCMLFVFSEIYNYYGIANYVGKVRFKILRRIIESVFVAQIPIIAWLIITLINKGTSNLFAKVPFLEIRLVPFCLLIGLFLFFLDKLLEMIRILWINIILNLTLSFFSVALAYQLMYLFEAPEIIKTSMLDWEILVVPFLITLYRLYIRLQKNKIAGLLQEKELELSKQKELKFKSDLNALQARINPHFLYNALNSLASLTHIDQDRTEKMALSLSRLFRYNINKNGEHYASLKDEMEMAEIYLQVEKNRFEDKLSYSLEIQEHLKEFIIPRFILQPLAENAVKHGISKITGKGMIMIKIFEEAGKVIIEIYDNGPAFPGGLISGYGLQNTYEKLKLLYKKPFDISFINNPEKKLVITLTK